MSMILATWTLIGVIIAAGVSFVIEMRSSSVKFRDEMKGEFGQLRSELIQTNIRIDGISSELNSINLALGQVVAKAHVHEHVG